MATRSKSPKKDSAPEFVADPEAKERARAAQQGRRRSKEGFFDKYGYHVAIGVCVGLMVIAIISSVWKSGPDVEVTLVNDEGYIAQRNNAKLTFTVGATPHFEGYTLLNAKRLIGTQASNKQQLFRCNTGSKDSILPESFNFREEYPACAREIVAQGNCSSSYSLVAASAITDRWCKGDQQSYPILSAQSPLACDKVINQHCKGGFVSRTLDFAKLYGLVEESCYGYNETLDAPDVCQGKIAQCKKHKISDYCVSSELENIKQEIFHYGPVIVVIPVYRDFLIYNGGVYQVYPGNQKFSSGHAVKIIGWDTRDGKSCWLIENTWGPEWGEKGLAYDFIYLDAS